MSVVMAKTAQEVRLPPDIPLDEVPVLVENRRWWRQTDPKYDALDLPHRARSGGRCHRKGHPPRLYASSSSNGAWGELFRHASEVSPFEVIRKMSTIQVSKLPVVNFDDALIRELFNVTEKELTSNSYVICRRLADLLRTRPDLFGGMILPSAAIPGEQTLVVFSEWVPGHLRVLRRSTSTVPIRLLRLFEAVAQNLSRRMRQETVPVTRAVRQEVDAAAKHELERIRRRLNP